ncbi:MAG: filamentous hemagglutinin N-terminal domain-containing protein [Candidatus Caenarcaniphilales bacterium]|nr:filamentous hemagglutinin N-terminal domain-containing protein [Candidatus Caenarcaniphilales bacterium]
MKNTQTKFGTFLLGKVAGKVDFCKLLGISGLMLSLANIPEFGHAVPAINTLPTGYSSPTGNVAFSQTGNTLNVNSAADKSIANYQTFSVGSGAAVNFNLPSANASILNRVVGPNASEIYGSMRSNGKVFLINPNGVLFGSTSRVNVNSLVTSTLGIANEDFMSGNYVFTQSGAPAGIINQGSIVTTPGGLAALIAGAVRNDGTIQTTSGGTRLAVGQKVTLDLGDGVNATVTVDEALQSKVAGYTDGIINNGVIAADGGSIKANAYLANSMYDTLVNNKGLMQANGLVSRAGEIELSGFTEDCTGTVANSGNLIASRMRNGVLERDGLIQLLGDRLELTSGEIFAKSTSLFAYEGFDIGSRVNTDDLRLRSINGGITQSAPIVNAERTSIIAKGPVTLTNAENEMYDFAAVLTGDGSDLTIFESTNLKVNDVHGLVGIVTNNGDVRLTATENIELDDIIHAGKGDIHLTAGKSIKQHNRMISGDEIFLSAGENIEGSGYLNDYFLADANNITSNVAFRGVTVDQLNNGFDLGSATETRWVQTGEKRMVWKDVTREVPVSNSSSGGTLPTPSVNVNDGAFTAYLESLVESGVSNGQNSGSAGNASSDINDQLFRQIVNDFKNNIQQNSSGDAVDLNGTFTHSFKLADGRTVRVTGSFAEFMRASQQSGRTEKITTRELVEENVYKEEPYQVNFTERALARVRDSKNDLGVGEGITADWNSLDCPDCKPKLTADASQISRKFNEQSLRDRAQEQEELNEYNNRYNFEWEVLPAENTPIPVVETPAPETPAPVVERPTPVIAEVPVTPGLPTQLNSIHDLTPKLISTATFTNGVVSMLPGTTQLASAAPVIGAPVFYQPNGIASVPAVPAVPSTQLAEAGPSIAAPQFYMPEAPAPAEEASNVAQPVFYIPGMW